MDNISITEKKVISIHTVAVDYENEAVLTIKIDPKRMGAKIAVLDMGYDDDVNSLCMEPSELKKIGELFIKEAELLLKE